MSAASRNIIKIVVGSAIGGAVAAAVTNLAERDESTGGEPEPITETIRLAPTRLRDRWERAKAAGDAAETAERALLTEIFRTKVKDSDALSPPRPPSS